MNETQNIETQNAMEQTTPTLTKRIGGMTYKVGIHFSSTSKETMHDKMRRMVLAESHGTHIKVKND
jgi:hypothetical protein